MEEAQSPPPADSLPPTPADNATTRRNPFRSDVRNTLGCVLAVGVVWLGYQVHVARRQVAAVVAIRALGGRITYADQLPFAARPWAPKWLRNSLGDDLFISVIGVNLAGTNVNDEDLERLAELPQLCILSLDETQVGNEGLKHVAGLHYLEELRLCNTKVGDNGLESLTASSSLRLLDLEGTQVSDRGLMQLADLPKLIQVYLVGTHVTEQGVRRFRGAAPTVIVQTESRRRRRGSR
jgi:hypothetical protein